MNLSEGEGDDYFLLYETNQCIVAWFESYDGMGAFVLNSSNNNYYWNYSICFWEDKTAIHPVLPQDMRLGTPVLECIYAITVINWNDYE